MAVTPVVKRSKWHMWIYLSDSECTDAEVSEYVGVLQPDINGSIATVLVVPILLTLLLKHKHIISCHSLVRSTNKPSFHHTWLQTIRIRH